MLPVSASSTRTRARALGARSALIRSVASWGLRPPTLTFSTRTDAGTWRLTYQASTT